MDIERVDKLLNQYDKTMAEREELAALIAAGRFPGGSGMHQLNILDTRLSVIMRKAIRAAHK